MTPPRRADASGVSGGASAPLSVTGGYPGYQIFMLLLCVFALAGVGVQNLVALDPETNIILDYADYAVCAFFLVDFTLSLRRSNDRWRYMRTWGWLDLISSIPTLDFARWGRLARIARISRVLRGLRATKLLTTVVLRQRSQNTVLAAALAALLLVFASSTAMLHFETTLDASIKTAEDAVWWAVATITTVGYGDMVPVSTEGRVVAAILMTAGVGLFGVFAAALAAWFLAPQEAAVDELQAMREELAAMRAAIEKLGIQS
jgi:voltage-gated potassium channel